ncbi:hypothetical protein TNCV_130381 [Trichonephila clavipes]|nr:hypothetical protein TNCV_130381 [Trichonephila clavipes]
MYEFSTKTWTLAKVDSRSKNTRSYIAQNSTGKTFVRNHVYLRPSDIPFTISEDIDLEMPETSESQPVLPNVLQVPDAPQAQMSRTQTRKFLVKAVLTGATKHHLFMRYYAKIEFRRTSCNEIMELFTQVFKREYSLKYHLTVETIRIVILLKLSLERDEGPIVDKALFAHAVRRL